MLYLRKIYVGKKITFKTLLKYKKYFLYYDMFKKTFAIHSNKN